MATVSSIIEHIEITPGACGGKPRIAGQRITVQNIAICYEYIGMSPEEIPRAYPSLTLADVHAALAYYHDHKGAIDESIRRDREFVEELKREKPSILEKLRAEDPERFRRALERLGAESEERS